ncbi:MAG: hypothetical protein M3N29_03195 [Chloroflexota bacterium]|nr:hypothetical protein [Chloroflexota bacterium]
MSDAGRNDETSEHPIARSDAGRPPEPSAGGWGPPPPSAGPPPPGYPQSSPWQQSPPSHEPNYQQPGWQQPAQSGWQSQQAWGQPAHTGPARYATSPLALLAGLALLLLGLLWTGLAVLILANSELVQAQLEREILLNPELRDRADVAVGFFYGVVGFFLIVGLLKLLAALGVFLHKTWGRLLGIVLAILGLLITLAIVTASPDALTLGVLVAYIVALVGLFAGGSHFRRQYAPR